VPRQLDAELFPGIRLEIGGVTQQVRPAQPRRCDAASRPARHKARRG
jgi:hypothetical protein